MIYRQDGGEGSGEEGGEWYQPVLNYFCGGGSGSKTVGSEIDIRDGVEALSKEDKTKNQIPLDVEKKAPIRPLHVYTYALPLQPANPFFKKSNQ